MPEKTATARSDAARCAGVYPLVLALRDAQLEPAAVIASHSGVGEEGWRIELRFEGFAAGIDAQLARAYEIAGAHRARAGASGRRDVANGSANDVIAKASFRPNAFEEVAAAFERGGVRARVYPARGTARVRLGTESLGEPARAVGELRAVLGRAGGTLAIERMPFTWYDAVDPWGPAPPALRLMRALKDNFDPARRLNRGRFIGGL